MRRTFVWLTLLLAAGPLWGQKVTLPKEVAADPGTFAVVKAETDCSSLRWVALDPGLSLMPPELLRDTRSAVVMAGKPGRYRLLAYGALKDQASEPAIVVVVVGQAPPPGPDPGPGPGPVDPLTATLQAAYAGEADPAKAKQLEGLRAFYRQAQQTVATPSITTWGGLFGVMRSAAAAMELSGKLPAVQRTIQAELVKVLPTDAALPLDPPGRQLAANTFARIASALEGVKP